MLAIIEAYKAGLLKTKYLQTNIIAGTIVGIVALPLAMAFAVASGYKPEQGIYTAIIAGLIVGLFGGTRVQIAGPTGAFVVILASIGTQYGITGLQIATIMAGVILVIMGFLKIGNVIKFIPYPVIIGFTSGIGIIIFISALKDFFGLPIKIPLDAHFYQKVTLIAQNFPSFNLQTTVLAFFSLVCIIFSPKIFKKLPGPLVAMVLATGLQILFQFKNIATIGSIFGKLPQSLPEFQLPNINANSLMLLMAPAFTIALLCAIESLLSAAAADAIMNYRHDSNQELIGQGLANIIAPFWGGFASTGAIARTVTNIRNGGTSPIAAIIHSILLILIIMLLAPIAFYIPLCTLAAILFVIAFNMSDFPEFTHIIKQAPWYDTIILLITFLLTIFTDLVIAVFVGVILAIILLLMRMHIAHKIYRLSWNLKKSLIPKKIQASRTENIIIFTLEGPFYFGVAEQLEHALATTHTDPHAIIFNFASVPFIDMTGLATLSKITDRYHKRNINVYFCQANRIVAHKLEKMGIITKTEIFSSLQNAVEASKKN